ncbi:hypothetical protein [Streptomyces jumonjinensis]|uniref:hypothetical protein n=1 Tax=Streptomyces jumonjinensis TaxID=1945 RepID=UPI003790BB6B
MESGNAPDATSRYVTRDGKGRWIPTHASIERDARAADLRSQGRTYQQIADELGFFSKKEAWTACRRAKDYVLRAPAERLVAAESEELDDLYAMALDILDHHHVTVSHGKVVTWINPATGVEEPLPDDGPKLQALQVALRIRKSYRELHGLDAEKKLNVSGGVRYEVVGIDPADLT